MSCRKRRISSTSATDFPQTKRARLLSDLWQNREDSHSIDSATVSQESEFSIRAIIGEKPGEYFIDWADNSVTGESYSPDWVSGPMVFSLNCSFPRLSLKSLMIATSSRDQANAAHQQPKRNVSKEAIAAWENQKIVQHSKKKLRRRRRRRSSTLSVTIHCSATPISKKSQSCRSKRSARKDLDRQASRNFQDHYSVKSIPPAVTVVVSQHSSLDHDKYILYKSSLSTSASSYLPQHYDSGIGESSPEPQEHRYLQSKVIPDSQPTPTDSIHTASSTVPAATGNDSASGSSARNSRQVNSPQAFTQGIGLPNSEAYQDHLPDYTIDCASPQRRSSKPVRFAIAEDKEDDTSTTQDTSASVVLTQRDANSQSQGRSVDSEIQDPPIARSRSSFRASLRQSSGDISSKVPLDMSATDHTASAMDTSQRSSQIAEYPRVPIGERLKQMRNAAKAKQAPLVLTDTDMSDAGIPPIADRSPSEVTRTIDATKIDQIEPSQSASEPVPTTADGSGRSAKIYATLQSPQAKLNGLSSEKEPVGPRQSSAQRQSPGPRQPSTQRQSPAPRQSPTPQLLLTPQPGAHTTPERQPHFQARPTSVPVGVPLAVRSSPGDQRTFSGRNHLSRHQDSANSPQKTLLKPLGFDMNEHIITLGMSFRVRNQYTSIISVYRDAIMKLMESNSQDHDTTEKITKLLTRISNVLQHSDLDAEEARDYSSQPSPEDEATWAEQCSFKFCFLRHFLEEIRHHDMHVSIVAQPGRLLDLIEMFLLGRGIVYFRPDGKGSSHPADQRFAHCRCQVSIVPSGPGGSNLALKPAALVIAFDGSVNAMMPQVHRMRLPFLQEEQNWLQPIVRLIIIKSAEHLAVCLPKEIEQVDRIRRIVSGMTQLRHEAGILQPEDMEVSAAAEEVAIALRLGGHQSRWTLPSVRPLSLDFQDSSRSSSTQEGSQLSQESEDFFESSTLKRAWDITDSAVPDRNKRQRISSVAGNAHLQNLNESQIANNLLQKNAELIAEIENLRIQISKLDRLAASHKALEAQIATLTRQNKIEASTQSTHQSHLSSLEASLNALQTRYESKDRAYQTLHLQKTDLESSLAASLQKQSTQSTEITSLRAAKKQLETDLEQTRKDLVTTPHENPDISRIAIAESHAREAQAANELLTKKVAFLTSDLEFTRGEYQTASTSAADLASQLSIAEAQLELANRKASGEAVRLATVNRDNAVKEARKEVRQVKAMMEERER
ncbi:MAG: hypothetical protein Q9226_000228, partial [Calogaya cf. arnoldii]